MEVIVIDSKTHKFVTEQAISILNIEEFNNIKEPLIFYSAQPDTDEKDGVFKNHFYNPATRKNFRGERQSAMTKFIEHYDNAVIFSGNKVNYYEHLGRCIHFLVDMNTPVHTYYEDLYDATTKLPSHVKFEKRCDELLNSINVDFSDFNYNKYLYNTIKDIAKNCVRKANILYYDYSNNIKKLDEIAINSIVNSIESVCGILYKFHNEDIQFYTKVEQ